MSFIILTRQSGGTGFCATPALNSGSTRTGMIPPGASQLFASSQYSRTKISVRAGRKQRHPDDFSRPAGKDRHAVFGMGAGLNGELDGVQGDFVIRRSRVHHRSWQLLSRSRSRSRIPLQKTGTARAGLPKKRHKTGARAECAEL